MLKILNIGFLLFISFYSGATSKQDAINESIHKLRYLLNENWIIEPVKNGFSVYYFRNLKSNIYDIKSDIEISNYGTGYARVNGYVPIKGQRKAKKEFLNDVIYNEKLKPDSISWYCFMNPAYVYNPSNEYIRELYPKNGILKIDVRFEKKWSTQKVEHIQTLNDSLADIIMGKPLLRANEDIFKDYRYWLPTRRNWQGRLKDIDYFFERLPYESMTNEYSILIDPGADCFYCDPVYVDNTDSLFFEKDNNFLEEERKRTLRIIALSLGIQDYKMVR